MSEHGNASDRTVFLGTAEYYATYRPPYPEALLADILKKVGEINGSLLDLGCGTGELTLPLSSRFHRVTAVDTEPEMIRVAQRKAADSNVSNISWIVGRSEDVSISPHEWDYITAGSSFHWMDRDLLSRRIFDALRPGHVFFLVGGGSSAWSGSEPWQQIVVQVIERWLGKERRAGAGVYSVDKIHQDYLVPAGFEIEMNEYPVTLRWTIDRLLGYLYSTSYANPSILGENRDKFESDLRNSLHDLDPAEGYSEEIAYYVINARKPQVVG